MKFQCTTCDIEADSKNDEKFHLCKQHNHELMAMSNGDEEKRTTLPKQHTKTIVKKIKGTVGNYFVESILVDGKPCFLCTIKDENTLVLKENIQLDSIIYTPLSQDECGYLPYSFSSSEIIGLIGSDISKDELLIEIKEQIDRFINAREIDKHLILGDLFLTYCQEWISTLHYPYFVGETESGKSSALHLVKQLGYRTLYGEDIPHADIYNFLGTDEEGTGTIAEDEAQDLWQNREKIRTYKGSYAKGSVKARVLILHNKKIQVYYKTFCPKWFAGEKIPLDKGFLERLAVIHMTEGEPKSNIKRLTQEEEEQLRQLRNRLLVWKIQNIFKGILRIDSGLKQRDQELWEDFLSVVHGTKFYDKCQRVVTYYIEQRHQVIRNSLEAKVFKLIIDKLNQGLEINFLDFWDYITKDNSYLPGKLDESRAKTFYPEDFSYKITPQSLAKIFEDKFQACKKQKRIRDEDGVQRQTSCYAFKKDVTEKLAKKYGINIPLDSPIYVSQLGAHGALQDNSDDQVDIVDQPNTSIPNEENENE